MIGDVVGRIRRERLAVRRGAELIKHTWRSVGSVHYGGEPTIVVGPEAVAGIRRIPVIKRIVGASGPDKRNEAVLACVQSHRVGKVWVHRRV